MPSSKKPATRTTVPHSIAAAKFKAICLELMDDVKERRVEYVVTKRGEPVAKLAPVDATAPSPFGFMRGTVLEEHDLVAPDFTAWAESGGDPLGQR